MPSPLTMLTPPAAFDHRRRADVRKPGVESGRSSCVLPREGDEHGGFNTRVFLTMQC
jgi:hypothetical protein